MSVSVVDEGDRVMFMNSDLARLYFVKPTEDVPYSGQITTNGNWYVSKEGVDELIAILTSIRQML